MYSEKLSDAVIGKKKFEEAFYEKYPKATERLEKDWTELTAFFTLPALHWTHLRTTNAIESTFSTVRLRTNVTRGAGSPLAASTMAYKLLLDAEKRWNRIRGYEEIENVLNGVAYVNGVVVPETSSTRQEVPAA